MGAMVGGFINRLFENGGDRDKPVVGMGGTAFYYSDRSTFTITEVVDANTVKARGDTPIIAPGTGMSGYASDYKLATGPEFTIVKTLTGWRTAEYTPTGRLSRKRGAGTPVRFGGRDYYRDPHF